MESAEFEERRKETIEKADFQYGGIYFPPMSSPEILKNLEDFEVREDDLILSTGFKCGTHWMAEVLLLAQVDGEVDNIVRDVDQNALLEFGAMPPDLRFTCLEKLAKKPSPRFYMTHLPARLLPPQVWKKKPKIVYVTRDPKDAIVSFYKFATANPLEKTPPSWDSTFDKYITGKGTCLLSLWPVTGQPALSPDDSQSDNSDLGNSLPDNFYLGHAMPFLDISHSDNSYSEQLPSGCTSTTSSQTIPTQGAHTNTAAPNTFSPSSGSSCLITLKNKRPRIGVLRVGELELFRRRLSGCWPSVNLCGIYKSNRAGGAGVF